MHHKQTMPSRKQQAWRYMQKARHSNAIPLLQEIIKSKPKDAEAQYMLGCSQASLGHWNEAIEALKHSIRIQPDVAQTHYALAGARIAAGQQAEAINSLHRALALNERMAEAHVVLANIFISEGKTDDARNSLKRALEIDPKMIDAHLGLAGIEQERGDYRESVPYLEQVLKHDANNVRALCAMADAKASLGQKKEARSFYRKALRIDHACLSAICGMALIYNFYGEYDKTTKLIDPLLKKNLYHPTLALAFLQSCHHSGQCKEAIDYTDKILEQPRLPRTAIKSLHFAAGRVLDRMAQYAAAFAHYKARNTPTISYRFSRPTCL
jgi:tetratricopeptide (TPR) repeat protein